MSLAIVEVHPGSKLVRVILPKISVDHEDIRDYDVKLMRLFPGVFCVKYGLKNSVERFISPIHLWSSAKIAMINVTRCSSSIPSGSVEIQLFLSDVIQKSSIGRFFRRQRKIEREICDIVPEHEAGHGICCQTCSASVVDPSLMSSELKGVIDLPSDEWMASCDSLACEECAPINITTASDPIEMIDWVGLGDRIVLLPSRVFCREYAVFSDKNDVVCGACGEIIGEKCTGKRGDFDLIELFKNKIRLKVGDGSGSHFKASANLMDFIYHTTTSEVDHTHIHSKCCQTINENGTCKQGATLDWTSVDWTASHCSNTSKLMENMFEALQLLPLPPCDGALGEVGVGDASVSCVIVSPIYQDCAESEALLKEGKNEEESHSRWPLSRGKKTERTFDVPALDVCASADACSSILRRNEELRWAVLAGSEVSRSLLSVVCLKKKARIPRIAPKQEEQSN